MRSVGGVLGGNQGVVADIPGSIERTVPELRRNSVSDTANRRSDRIPDFRQVSNPEKQLLGTYRNGSTGTLLHKGHEK